MSTPARAPTIGVLALQGDVREHLAMLQRCGASAVRVRRASELTGLDGIVLPGGESTTMATLARTFELMDPLREALDAGLPAFGTCAGMILLADRLEDAVAGQETLGGLDVVVRRNAFGRQVDSFEATVRIDATGHSAFDFPATFIRGPWVEQVGASVEVIARVGGQDPAGRAPGTEARSATLGRIVAVRQGRLLATAFHPEISGDARMHQLFVDLIRADRA